MITKKNKILIIRLIIALFLWITSITLEHTLTYSIQIEIIYLSIYVIAYLIAGYDILLSAVKNVFSGNFLDEYFLMSIASLGAFFIRFFGENEYLEAVAVMIFFQVGEVFQGIAVERSKNAILDTMNLKVELCTLKNGEVVDPNNVNVGDIILVKPGEVVAIDGIAINQGIINQASLTGEALDLLINPGDLVLSGSINKNTVLELKTVKEYSNSCATKILDLVENATMKKAKVEKFISKFAKIYTPIVVLIALILAIVPPVIIGSINGFSNELWNSYIYAALTCLVVSCPCALVVSVPLTYFAGIGASAKNKIIVKGAQTLDTLSKVDTIVMDKTGTITKSEFEIAKIYGDEKEIIKIAKGLELNSTHPLARAINKYESDYYEFEIEEKPGYGIIGYKDGIKYLCGSKKLLEENNINPIIIENINTSLYIARANECIGAITLEDSIKEEAFDAISSLKNNGNNIYVLSGDNQLSVSNVCDKLGIINYYSSLLPEDKVNKVEEIINKEDTNKVIFVGDGINDAPVLALADVGVSMGQIGSDSAIEASDVVLLNDNLCNLPLMLKIAKKTKRIVIENIIFSIGIKVIILLLCILSNTNIVPKLPMWLAIFGDVGVCVIAIFNALRALFIKNEYEKK